MPDRSARIPACAARILVCAALALVGWGQTADARGFRLRGTGARPVVFVGDVIGPTRREAPLARTAVAVPAVTGTLTRSVLSGERHSGPEAPMPGEAAVPPRPAPDAWCRTGRIAGAGTGFCLIN